jgi:hypothetical protein
MKKELILSMLPFFAFANSNYEGIYVCNDNQQVTITTNNLYIGNANFKYHSSKTDIKTTDFFVYKTDVAMFVEYLNEEKVYSLNIRNLQDKSISPYVGRCFKVYK